MPPCGNLGDDGEYSVETPNHSGFAIGDVVKGYFKGYFIITKIERRFWPQGTGPYHQGKPEDEGSPLCYGVQIFDEKGKKYVAKNPKCWDMSFTKHALPDVEEKIARLENVKAAIGSTKK